MLKTATVVFEDKWILVVDKKSGVVVNRSQTISELTLQDDLADYLKLGSDDLGIGDRAGIVHRLDRETSGLLVVAKTQKAFENLQAQFKEREVSKEYIALVHGYIKDQSGTIESKIARVGKFGKFGVVDRRSDGRESRTDFLVLERYSFRKERFDEILYSSSESEGRVEKSNTLSSRLRSNNNRLGLTKSRLNYLKQNSRDYTLLSVLPKTGRTHQVRVHLKSIGHPVVADLIYTPRKLIKFDLLWCPRLFLHASRLIFLHPSTKKPMEFKSDLPKDLKSAILNLEKIRNFST